MPSYQYMLYLFQVDVFDESNDCTKKPAWLWKQIDGTSATNLTATVVFGNREQMFTALQNSGLLDSTNLGMADRAFRDRALTNLQVEVPFGREKSITPNLQPGPGYVSPTPEFAAKVANLGKKKPL
jgi:hypothetical protein